jgi:hypothetical protein
MAPREKTMDKKTKKAPQKQTLIQSRLKIENLITQGKIGKA